MKHGLVVIVLVFIYQNEKKRNLVNKKILHK